MTLRTMDCETVPFEARRLAQRDIAAWLARGSAVHSVAAVFPLAETARAHEAVEAGDKRGTVVVDRSR